jgi:medium-chain acyl-[acyl-carrier-protein] hydrolase
MSERYTEDFEVKSIDINSKKQLILKRLFQYFQETAGNQLTSTDASVEKLNSRDMTWVISRLSVQFLTLPKWKDKIKVETWPVAFDGTTAFRDYQITDKDSGEITVKACGRWVIIDRNTRKRTEKPLPIEALPVYKEIRAVNNYPERIETLKNHNCERLFTVRYSEIDFNGHVNNTRYPMWILDTLGMDFLNMHTINSIDINYISELKYGDRISVKTIREDDESDCHVLRHSITKTESGRLSATAITRWMQDNNHHISEKQFPHIINPEIGHKCPEC